MTFRTITESEARAIMADENAENLPFQFINELGLAEIHQFLALRHKLHVDHFDRAALSSWAAEAEFQLGEGNPACIEIKSLDTVSGHTETFDISDAGVEWAIND
jgi:hypothetical protein